MSAAWLALVFPLFNSLFSAASGNILRLLRLNGACQYAQRQFRVDQSQVQIELLDISLMLRRHIGHVIALIQRLKQLGLQLLLNLLPVVLESVQHVHVIAVTYFRLELGLAKRFFLIGCRVLIRGHFKQILLDSRLLRLQIRLLQIGVYSLIVIHGLLVPAIVSHIWRKIFNFLFKKKISIFFKIVSNTQFYLQQFVHRPNSAKSAARLGPVWRPRQGQSMWQPRHGNSNPGSYS